MFSRDIERKVALLERFKSEYDYLMDNHPLSLEGLSYSDYVQFSHLDQELQKVKGELYEVNNTLEELRASKVQLKSVPLRKKAYAAS